MQVFILLALGASLASALNFTSPPVNSTLVKGSTYDVTWDTVDTDPSLMSIYLVNFVQWPPSYQALDVDVDVDTGVASVYIPCSTPSSYGWQFNAINGTNVFVIYAQSALFSIGGSACIDPPSPPYANSTCPAVATVTATVTVSGPNSRTISPSTSTTHPKSDSPSCSKGTVPKTIGWLSSGYSNPVTLSKVPTAGQPTVTVKPATSGGATGATPLTIYTTTYVQATDCPAY